MLASLLAFVFAMAAATPVHAQSSVRILVNDEPITSFDIQTRTRMLNVFSRGQQGESEAIEQLIDERLMLQEAERRGMEVSDEQVDEEFASRAASAQMSPEQFGQALRQAGVDPQTFRDYLRANMAWADIVRARFRATEEITEQDVAAALTAEEETGEQLTAFEYMLQPIIFVVPAEAGAGLEGQRRNEASAFRNAFQGCDQSLELAGTMPGVVVRPTVRREAAQLGNLAEAIAALEVGGITEPQRVEEGFQLLAVCARNEIAGQTQASTEVRSELGAERAQLLARRYLRDLRSDAVIEYR